MALRLIDADDPTRTELVAQVGLSARLAAELRHGSIDDGASGRAMAEGGLVVIEGYSSSPAAIAHLVEADLQAVMAAPVHQNGRVCGSLAVGTHVHGRVYSDSEREVLLAFAEHASLALTDARNFGEALHQASHDSLTDLPNRELFAAQLEDPWSRRPSAAASWPSCSSTSTASRA